MCASSQYSDNQNKECCRTALIKSKALQNKLFIFIVMFAVEKKEKQATAVLGFKAKRKDDMVW